jgi:5-bromo-4-chloroindolyl phosphate hydrolysis protein
MGTLLLRLTRKHLVLINLFAMIAEERMLLFKQRKATSTRLTSRPKLLKNLQLTLKDYPRIRLCNLKMMNSQR